MKKDEAVQDVTALLKARNTLVWIESGEELRVERALIDIASTMTMEIRFWDCSDGIQGANNETLVDRTTDPVAALNYVLSQKQRSLYVFRDLHKWMDPQVLRKLRSAGRRLQTATKNEARTIVVLAPSMEIPPELTGIPTVAWPLPDREEMGMILDDLVGSLDERLQATAFPEEGSRSAAIDAAVGLTAEEANNSFSRSLVTTQCVDPVTVAAEKKQIISKSGVLTWYDPDPRGLDSIGGLDVLKDWLVKRHSAFSANARDFGLPAPKGVLLVGHPGTGKSLTAKAVGTAWGQPLLRLDPGGLKSKYVGDSEQNARKAFAVAETVAPCILWIDEIDKALAGSDGPQGDGGVSSDFLGTFLSWMQDRAGAVFVVATANDVSSLPPALLRKGRFDEMFFVDLPTARERIAILRAALLRFGRDPDVILKDIDDRQSIIDGTDEFTGAEIDAVIPDALFAAFADDERDLTAQDIIDAVSTVVPLSSTSSDSIEELRSWAKGKARRASSEETVSTSRGRSIEV